MYHFQVSFKWHLKNITSISLLWFKGHTLCSIKKNKNKKLTSTRISFNLSSLFIEKYEHPIKKKINPSKLKMTVWRLILLWTPAYKFSYMNSHWSLNHYNMEVGQLPASKKVKNKIKKQLEWKIYLTAHSIKKGSALPSTYCTKWTNIFTPQMSLNINVSSNGDKYHYLLIVYHTSLTHIWNKLNTYGMWKIPPSVSYWLIHKKIYLVKG